MAKGRCFCVLERKPCKLDAGKSVGDCVSLRVGASCASKAEGVKAMDSHQGRTAGRDTARGVRGNKRSEPKSKRREAADREGNHAGEREEERLAEADAGHGSHSSVDEPGMVGRIMDSSWLSRCHGRFALAGPWCACCCCGTCSASACPWDGCSRKSPVGCAMMVTSRSWRAKLS